MNDLSVSQTDVSEIARGAYLLWEAAGRPEGRALEHWLEAEARLRDRIAAGGAAEKMRGSTVAGETGQTSGRRYGLVLKNRVSMEK